MGVVFMAWDRDHDRQVALKVLHPHLRRDPEQRARFLREGNVVRRLEHPGIARLYESGEVRLQDGGSAMFLAMEFVPGKDLQQRMVREDFDPARAVDVALQIAKALEAAHAQGVVHRDLKPANIKLSSDGHVSVLDFGLAKVLPSPDDSAHDAAPAEDNVFESQVGVVLGTPQYSAPEQLLGEEVDARADLYSLGVLLYQMLEEKVPFPGLTATEVAARAASGTLKLEWTQTVPEELRSLVADLLAPRKATRLASAEAAVARLSALAESLASSAAPGELLKEEESPSDDAEARSIGGRGIRWGIAAVVLLILALTLYWLL